MENPVNKHLIFEHFADRVTSIQRRMIAHWLTKAEHKEQYYAWLEEWETLNPQYAVDMDRGLQQSLATLLAGHAPNEHTPTSRSLPVSRFSWRWVAVVAGLLLLAGLYRSRSYLLYQSIDTTNGEIRSFTLPDGSRITLNANSSLRYNRFTFDRQRRQVFLVGEASFEVKHQADNRQFIVSTDHQLDVIVLGTQFSVYCRPRGTKVVLQKGKVELVRTDPRAIRRITMKPGDLVSLDTAGSFSMKRLTRPEAYIAWQNHRFEFDQTTLADIARLLEETYGMRVTITETALARRTVSGTFSTRTATELSRVIADLLAVDVRQNGDRLTFSQPLPNP